MPLSPDFPPSNPSCACHDEYAYLTGEIHALRNDSNTNSVFVVNQLSRIADALEAANNVALDNTLILALVNGFVSNPDTWKSILTNSKYKDIEYGEALEDIVNRVKNEL